MGVLAVGIGGGVGTFLGWFSRDFSRRELVFLLLLTVTATLIGAWIGLHSSRDAFKLVGRPGIPALTGIVVGAILSGNILRLCLWTISAARNPAAYRRSAPYSAYIGIRSARVRAGAGGDRSDPSSSLQEVERHDHQEYRQTGEERTPPGRRHVGAPFGDDQTPRGSRSRNPPRR